MSLTYSPQKGTINHCFAAQVWGDGKSVAVIEPTEDPAEATRLARQFAASTDLLNFARDIATNYDHEGNDECRRSCRVCKAELVLRKAAEGAA